MDFGTSIKGIESSVGGAGKAFPEAKGYQGVILKAEDKYSSKGTPMMVLTVDIADGQFKGFFEGKGLIYQTYGNDIGKSILKGIIETAQKENPANIVGADFTATGFNEQKLVGCKVGLVLDWKWSEKHSKYFLNPGFICPADKALERVAKERPIAGPNGEPIIERGATGSASTKAADDLPF